MHCFHIQVLVSLVLVSVTSCKQNVKCMVKLEPTVVDGTCLPAEVSDCHESDVCQKQFNISYVEHIAYSVDIISDLIRQCCGPCANSLQVNTLTKRSGITLSLMNRSHFAFPILGRRDSRRLYGYDFIPLVQTPSVYYITLKQNSLIHGLVISCLNMWPLLIIIMLMVTISGFICWLLETWGNRDEFPRAFLSGWFEGIWWSFISMTTVGYGDKAPKSLPARLFSIAWIVLGITTFSLVTAMLTSEMSDFNSQPPPKMAGATVGVIRQHLYEMVIIASQGGILVATETVNFTDGIQKLIEMLDHKAVDGFALDRYELMLFYNHFGDHAKYKEGIQYIRKNTVLTEIVHTDQLTYGILVKNEDDYEFFSEFVESNRDVINSCTNLFLSNYSQKLHVRHEDQSPFSPDGGMFWPSFVSCAVVIVVVLICGATYELRTRVPSAKWSCRTHHEIDKRENGFTEEIV